MTILTSRLMCGSFLLVFLLIPTLLPAPVNAQDNLSPKGKELYEQIKAFPLNGGSVEVKGFVLQRDRANITFDGTFYFTAPVAGQVTGAVFIGVGRFNAAVPPGEFEKDNLKRLLDADSVDSSFKTAVLRFSDDTFELVGKNRREDATADERAAKLASEMEGRILKETGANISARVALSILNQEKPGFFFGSFDGGKLDRFSFLLDYQNRIPVANFNIDAGEKGLIFKYRREAFDNEIWMAFPALEDFQRGVVTYSDLSNLVDVVHYDLDLDLRDHKNRVRLVSRIAMLSRLPSLRAVSFKIGEGLTEYDNIRLQKQLRVKKARFGELDLAFAQEDWESGVTVFLRASVAADQRLDLELTLEGDFMREGQGYRDRNAAFGIPIGGMDTYYPRSTTSWFPRHGYLDRATFDLTFHHPRRLKVASIGMRLAEDPDPELKDVVVTKYRMQQPVALATFALGPFERHQQAVKWEKGGSGDPIMIEFNSLPSSLLALKEDFVLAELDNSLRYFTVLFGKYPYPVFGAAFHPFPFGQGFPSMMMIPPRDQASTFTYSFIAHETAHQWWGNIVAWRSYRDQWLSEGFAEYSGVLYSGLRGGTSARDDLLGRLRRSLVLHPQTETGISSERLVDVGPIILGHRLNSRKTRGAYQTLIYNKGALVLRMLHFLLSDPTSGDDRAFFAMLTDFVERYRNNFASTDDFQEVANEHFAKSPIGRTYRLNNLDWFFKQWVHRADMPSYRMEYQIQDQPDGKVMVTGTVTQEGVPDKWFMVLPVVFSFGGQDQALATVYAYGPKGTFQIKLPSRPRKVELDPYHWIISENTSTKGG